MNLRKRARLASATLWTLIYPSELWVYAILQCRPKTKLFITTSDLYNKLWNFIPYLVFFWNLSRKNQKSVEWEIDFPDKRGSGREASSPVLCPTIGSFHTVFVVIQLPWYWIIWKLSWNFKFNGWMEQIQKCDNKLSAKKRQREKERKWVIQRERHKEIEIVKDRGR